MNLANFQGLQQFLAKFLHVQAKMNITQRPKTDEGPFFEAGGVDYQDYGFSLIGNLLTRPQKAKMDLSELHEAKWVSASTMTRLYSKGSC